MSDAAALPTKQNLETMVQRKHVMLLYDSLEHYRNLASRYIANGLLQNDRCIMATDQYGSDQIREDFKGLDVDVDSFIRKGQLILVNVRESYAMDREFDPDETLKKWQFLTDKACQEGFDRLRVVGEASFVSGRPELYKKLIYYENIINLELFPKYPHISICVYGRELYPPEVVKAAIQAHPLLVYNDRFIDSNIYYVPPEIYFRKTSKDEELDRWLENMAVSNTTTQALIQSEEKFRTIFHNAGDIFYIHDLAADNLPGTIFEVNDEAVRRMGYTREEFFQMSPLDFSDKSSTDAGQIIKDLTSRGHVTFEARHRTKDGRMIPVEVSGHLFSLEGKSTVFSVVRDITFRKQAEEREKDLQDQLRQLQKNEAIGTLTGGIAHDFNNILTIILGYTELAQMQLDKKDPVHTSLDQVREGCTRARDIIRQLLTFARKKDQEKSNADIRPLIKEGVKMLRSTIPSGIEFRIEIPSDRDFPLVNVDATQIHQVLINLCTNACHAMAAMDTGTLCIDISAFELDDPTSVHHDLVDGSSIRIRVQDTGTGIQPENLERVFEPYFTTKGPLEGTGLGLSVVQGIVKSHGGAIRCSSEPGKGTTFDVYLPVASNDDRKTFEKEYNAPLPQGTETILLVDDEEDLINLGRERLSRLGYRVQATTDPKEALSLFASDPRAFDLVLTDMTMPGMSGLSLANLIKKIDPTTPIILCSGFHKTVSASSPRKSGIDRYLDKPVDLPTLAFSVRNLLDNPVHVPSNSL
jgi:PAS domain S-box-containing protein